MTDDTQEEYRWSARALFRLHPAILVAFLFGLAVFIGFTITGFKADNLIFAWDTGVFIYLCISWYFMMTSSVERLKRRATDIDLPDSQILFFSLAAAIASFTVIFLLLSNAHAGPQHSLAARPIEAAGTIFLSWVFVHTLFTVHYAHNFYANEGAARGLHFPADCEEPVYWDFLYFSFTIGVAAQTADVSVTSMPMRRLVLAHSFLSFLFNTTILALAVNVGASVI